MLPANENATGDPFDTSDEALKKKGINNMAVLEQGNKNISKLSLIVREGWKNMRDANLALHNQRP